MGRKIKILKIEDNLPSQFVQPFSVFYEENSKKKRWDCIKTHDSVACILYHSEKKELVLVKQFRPSVYMHDQKTDGFTYEICAGLLDKEKSDEQTMQEEILEECGYDVPLSRIERLFHFYMGVGFAGAKQTLFFAEIDESMKKEKGGGINDEFIEVFHLPISQAKEFMYDSSKPKTAGTMFAIIWLFDKYKF
ncbi:MAG: NUDIX domain-containing protein [Campylobacteraceae bacterium]|jgi:UDP-sugar diphosphatase|nr:NUDIX domain-containing protein [Campylobacteraceae bacterium]